MRSKAGKLSDLVEGQRADWSKFNNKLEALEPGEVLILECPPGFSVSKFRSTMLTVGRRKHTGDWRIASRTYGRKLHMFLAPRVWGMTKREREEYKQKLIDNLSPEKKVEYDALRAEQIAIENRRLEIETAILDIITSTPKKV